MLLSCFVGHPVCPVNIFTEDKRIFLCFSYLNTFHIVICIEYMLNIPGKISGITITIKNVLNKEKKSKEGGANPMYRRKRVKFMRHYWYDLSSPRMRRKNCFVFPNRFSLEGVMIEMK